jgi:phytoene dehydrogenase-like protein
MTNQNKNNTNKKIVIIGAGIAGLCAGVYARQCGYEVLLLEQGQTAGGLATSWRRGEYTFENCLHWLLGSKPGGPLHDKWQEVCDIDKLAFVDHDVHMRLETEGGESLTIYPDPDRLEAELLRVAPEDEKETCHFMRAIRRFAKWKMPDPSEGWSDKWPAMLGALPGLIRLRYWAGLSLKDYSERFTNPLLKGFFDSRTGALSQLTVLVDVLSLAWMSEHNAGYAIGGSQALIRAIQQRLSELGAHVHFGAKVEKILVENDAAVGVQLAGGETIAADRVISAADGHATIYDLLGGKYTGKAIDEAYRRLETFPSYVQVGLGVAMDLANQPVMLTRILNSPLQIDPHTELGQVAFRFFHFDPTFAPKGKTAVVCFLPTDNFAYWVDLEQHQPERYKEEKSRIAGAVIAELEKFVPNVRQAIEVVDVATPVTVIRYTGNWKGSFEGWLITPRTGFRPLPKTLPGLRQFMMIGQWTMPGGGLPSGVMTARSALQAICKRDGVRFCVTRERPKLAQAA